MAGAHDYTTLAHLHDAWVDAPAYPLGRDFPLAEYQLRIAAARRMLDAAGLDALVITSSVVGSWFTSALEPHEWHDLCPARSAWFVLTPDDDVLFMTPTAAGEHFNTTRRSTWVHSIRGIAERTEGAARAEIWALEQMPALLADLGLARARLGFELGDCMTLGLSVNDFLRLRELMPDAQLVDGSAVVRRLLSVLTPWELERLRRACQAADWIHAQVPHHLRPGITERALLAALGQAFAERFLEPYAYAPAGAWDVRNADGPADSNPFHAVATDRTFRAGDVLMRCYSGVAFENYTADTDRVWAVGSPSREVRDLYQLTWECNRAMAAAIRPGIECAEVYRAGARVEAAHGRPARRTGRTGHGYRNSGGLSVHPDNRTILETGMVLSVEPMFPTVHGFFDLEDQYVVTDDGAACLHEPAPELLPVIEG